MNLKFLDDRPLSKEEMTEMESAQTESKSEPKSEPAAEPKPKSRPHELHKTTSRPYQIGQDKPAPEPEAEIKPASLAAFSLTENIRQIWFWKPTPAVTIENIEDPRHFDLVKSKLQVHDRIEVILASGVWAELYCCFVELGSTCVVKLMRSFQLPPEPDIEVRFLPRGFRLDRDPITRLYSVTRLSDDQILVRDKATPVDARIELLNHATLRPTE